MTLVDLDRMRLAWLDLESTGLHPDQGEKLLQVAAIVTDGHLKEVADPFMVKIYYTEAEVEAMKAATNPYVLNMHTVTNLWATLPTEGVPLAQAQADLLAYFENAIGEPSSARIGGNSITLDRNFLHAFMPDVLNYLHYRSLDMTSISGFLEMFADLPYFEKAKSHDALDDIRESLAEARYCAAAIQQAFGTSLAEVAARLDG